MSVGDCLVMDSSVIIGNGVSDFSVVTPETPAEQPTVRSGVYCLTQAHLSPQKECSEDFDKRY